MGGQAGLLIKVAGIQLSGAYQYYMHRITPLNALRELDTNVHHCKAEGCVQISGP